MRPGMSPGGRNAAASGSTTARSGGSAPAAASSAARSGAWPRAAQTRTDSCSSHSPITLRRKRTVPSTPASLVNPASRLASVSTGPPSSIPARDQVPQEI